MMVGAVGMVTVYSYISIDDDNAERERRVLLALACVKKHFFYTSLNHGQSQCSKRPVKPFFLLNNVISFSLSFSLCVIMNKAFLLQLQKKQSLNFCSLSAASPAAQIQTKPQNLKTCLKAIIS